MAQVCPACAEPASEGDWCEACGADLDGAADTALSHASSDPCVSCAAPSTDIAADGYCGSCGHKQPDIRDHLEDDQGWIVMVTDRGKRHHRNEDFGAVAQVGSNSAMVVCDGVSTTDNPEQASLVATTAALDALVESLKSSAEIDGGVDGAGDVAAMQAAVRAGQDAALQVPQVVGGKGSPSCTFVASISRVTDTGVQITVGWLGDSRAYWIDGLGVASQLTTDHSWAYEQVADGLMTAEEANADRRAHTITRWLGDDAHELEPGIAVHHLPTNNPDASPEASPEGSSEGRDTSGRLLLCSDGLWNYADTDEAMTAQLEAQKGDSLLALAQNLVRFALDSGGHDNTTVAIADIPGPESQVPASQEPEPESPEVEDVTSD